MQLWACHCSSHNRPNSQRKSKSAPGKILNERGVTVLEEGGPVPESEEGGVDGFVFMGVQLHVFMGHQQLGRAGGTAMMVSRM